MLSKSFKAGKCKTSLKLAMARIKLLKNKRNVQVKQMRRDLAQLLETDQDQTARIRVEHVIREEKTMSAYDLIELYCELIVSRLPIIESQKNCPIDLKEAISSVIFASPRCADIPELLDVRKHFTAKYGKDFINSALELRPECGVNRMVVEKLSARAPDIETKIKVLKAVAQEHNIEWDTHAFEEQLQKPNEDLLNVPSNFSSATKTPMESSHVQAPTPPRQKHELATKISENDVERSSMCSTSFPSTNINTPSTPIPTTSWPEPEVSESSGEFRYSLPREKDSPSNRQSWNMEFKDATSAAQAAAESAERASMAARVAAEFASRGNHPRHSSGSHGPSVYSSRDGVHSESMGSKLKSEWVAKDSQKMGTNGVENTFGKKPAMQNQMRDGVLLDSFREAPEIIHEGYGSVKSRSSRAVSSPSSGPAVDDGISNVNPQKTNASQISSSDRYVINQNWGREKIGKDDSLGEESAKEYFSRSGSSLFSNSVFGNISEDLEKVNTHAQKSFFEAESINQNSKGEKNENADVGQGSIKRKSSKSASSGSTAGPFEDEIIWDSHDQKHETNVDEHYAIGAGKGVSSNQDSYTAYSSAVFGNSSFDDDDHLNIDNYSKKEEPDSYLPHQGAISPTISSRIYPWSPKQHRSEFLEKDSTSSQKNSLAEFHPVEFTDGVPKDTLPSHSKEFFPATYDDSDGLSSESDEERDNFTHRDVREAEPNVADDFNTRYDPSGLLQHQTSPRNRKSLSNSNDFERGSLDGPLDKEQQPLQSSKISSEEEENIGKLPSLPSSTKDSALPYFSNCEGGQELNLGRLMGGLRNKGFLHPPYVRSPLGDASSPSKQTADDTSATVDKSTVPHPNKAPTSSVVLNEEPYDQTPRLKVYKESKSRTPTTYFDSDSAEAKESQRHCALGSRGFDSDISLPSKQTVDDTPSTNEKQTVSHTYKTSEGYEPNNQEPFNQWLCMKASKESSPTTATAYADSGSDKLALHAVGSRGHSDRRVDASLPSDGNIDVTPPSIENSTVSHPYKTSSRSGISNLDVGNQKLHAKAYRGSRLRTTRSYFDSDSDEGEDLQPRHTGGSRGSKLSQRERGLQSESKVGRLSWSTSQSYVPDTSDLGSEPSQSSSSVSEPLSNPISQTLNSEKKRNSKFLQPKLSVEQPPLPLPQTGDLADREGANSSPKNSASNEKPKPSTSNGGLTSRESSLTSASHVHQKLPDYNALAAHFQSLRSNRGSL